jgi:hypothetical protein
MFVTHKWFISKLYKEFQITLKEIKKSTEKLEGVLNRKFTPKYPMANDYENVLSFISN